VVGSSPNSWWAGQPSVQADELLFLPAAGESSIEVSETPFGPL